MKNNLIAALARFLVLLCVGLPHALWAADNDVTLGVLAFRPKAETLARWQPTADYLASRIGRPVRLEALGYAELEAALSRHRLDFVLTNPGHYVLMTKRNGLSSPLATLIEEQNGQPLHQFGGVIVVRSDRRDINTLADLRGRTVATPDVGSLGGYQAEAYEMVQAGLPMPGSVKLLVTGMPHDRVIDAVLEGRADAGFVRTGLIEKMRQEGRLGPGRLKILNRRAAAGFPFLLSTSLYPEWPFAAMPHVDEDLARRVAAALYTMPFKHPASLHGGYYGWAIPSDYEPVRAVLQELRLPPYDRPPSFTWQDIFDKHRSAIVIGLVGLASVVGLLILLGIRHRQLRTQEQRLAESELRLRQFADNSNMVFWVRTQDEMLYINKAYETVWGRSRESLYQAPWSFADSLHPEDRERVLAAFEVEKADPGTFDQQFRILHMDGTVRWIHSRTFPIRDETGRIIRTSGVAEDITLRKAAEIALRQEAETRRRLLGALGEGVYGVAQDGRCTFVNPAAVAMLGFDEAELLGKDSHGLIHHHLPNGHPYPEADCPIFLTLQDGRPRHTDEWFFKRDGSGFPVEMTAAAMERDGVRYGAVVVFRDISERHAAQARDRLLVSALEAAANAILITDPEARIEWVNLAFEALTGFTRDESVGKRPAELVKSGVQDKGFYEAMWNTILAGKTWRGELVNKKKDGTLYDEELIIAPVLDESGQIQHFVGIKQDISERKRLEAELQQLATTDPLTGLPNRRHFLAMLEKEAARMQRSGSGSAALLMLDLDHFKLVNDNYGHAAGDKVLRSFAERVRDSLRKTDHAGRLGGEEFGVLLYGTERQGAVEFAERLRERIEAGEAEVGDGRTLRITVSIGVTQLSGDDVSADSALARADDALYRAKDGGRNRVEWA